jgi:hypothetical protein
MSTVGHLNNIHPCLFEWQWQLQVSHCEQGSCCWCCLLLVVMLLLVALQQQPNYTELACPRILALLVV